MRWSCGESLPRENPCVAFGCFDGFHRGHQSMCHTLLSQKGTPVVLCYPDGGSGPALTPFAEKQKRLSQAGVERIAFLEDADLSLEELAERYLIRQLGAKCVVVGKTTDEQRWRRLEELLGKFDCRLIACAPVLEGESPVDAGRIREALLRADLTAARSMLGRPYSIVGRVVHGKALGRTVGMPTANLAVPEEKFLPRHGVYAVKADVDGQVVAGITNIGTRPTVDQDQQVSVETLLMDFDRDIYGKTVELTLLSYIREIQKFPSLAAVREQVNRDLGAAREYLGRLDG